jgi:hypothetical protein
MLHVLNVHFLPKQFKKNGPTCMFCSTDCLLV